MNLTNRILTSRKEFQKSVSTLDRQPWMEDDKELDLLRSLTDYSQLQNISPSNLDCRKSDLSRHEVHLGEMALQIESSFDKRHFSQSILVVNKRALQQYAILMALIMRKIGVKPKSRLAIMDYSTSLPTLAASENYNALGIRGFAQILSVSTVCLDGLPDLIARSLYSIKHIKPTCLIVRSDLVQMLATSHSTRREPLDAISVIVTYDETDSHPINPKFMQSMSYLIRADRVLFCCLISRDQIYYDKSRFLIEVVKDANGEQVKEDQDGYLCVTRLFEPQREAIRYVTNIEASHRNGIIFLSGVNFP